MNSNRAFLLLKFVKNKQCLRRINLQKFSSSIQPVAAQTNLPETVNPAEDFLTFTSPTFNFAAYVNKSETLTKFVELGVDLSKIEKKKGLPQYVLQLDFERDVKKHLLLLHDLGLPADSYGYFLTKNPLIFKESIEDIETRVFYLRSKKFNMNDVQTIVAKNPYWLSFSTKRIDRRLGWFQKNFLLDGEETRFLTVKQPKLITYNMEHVRESTFSVREQMGFDKLEMKSLLLSKPNLWMNNHTELIERFDYVHNVMQISHKQILKSPEILTSRRHRLKQRFDFLRYLKKAQFDETKPGYISFKSFLEGSEKDFVIDVCKSTPEIYDDFCRTT